MGSLDEIRVSAPGYPHLPKSPPNQHNATITFTNEGVHSHSTFNTSSYLYGDRQNLHDPHMTPIHKPKRRRKTQRTLPPLQRTRAYSTSLPQEDLCTTRTCSKCTNHPSGHRPRDEATPIPDNGWRRCPPLSKKDDTRKSKQSGS